MKYALIKNSRIENIIVADADFAEQIKVMWDQVLLIEEKESPFIGQGIAGTKYISPVPKEIPIKSLEQLDREEDAKAERAALKALVDFEGSALTLQIKQIREARDKAKIIHRLKP